MLRFVQGGEAQALPRRLGGSAGDGEKGRAGWEVQNRPMYAQPQQGWKTQTVGLYSDHWQLSPPSCAVRWSGNHKRMQAAEFNGNVVLWGQSTPAVSGPYRGSAFTGTT